MNNKDTEYPALDGKSPWMLKAKEAVEQLASHSDEGLNPKQARKRLQKYGANRIEAGKQRSAWQIFTAQIKNLIVLLLAAAAGVSFILGQFLEGIAILAALIVNVFIGFGTELRAMRSMEALQQMTRRHAKVLRQAKIQKIDAAKLVPGDIVVLEGGDVIPADLRLIEANRIKADESALTGESVPVDKDVEALAGDTPLAEQNNMLFTGTALTQGSGKGVVVSTGMSTQLGHISRLAEGAQEEVLTPLEKMSLSGERAVTITFLILAFTRTWHVFNMRDAKSSVIFNDVTRNLFVWGAVILSIVLLVFAVYFPPLSRVLTMVAPTSFQWLFILGMSFIPLVVVQVLKQGTLFYKGTVEKGNSSDPSERK